MSPFIETIRIEKGRAYNLPFHNERMNRTRERVLQASSPLNLSDYIDPRDYQERTKCRVEYTTGILKVEYAPYQVRPVNSLRLVEDNELDYPYKSTDRTRLNELYAQRGDADDILIVKNGYLTDTSICNIALWDGQRWQTPRSSLLAGTQRACLLATGDLYVGDISRFDLHRYLRIRLFNAMIGFGEIEFSVENLLKD